MLDTIDAAPKTEDLAEHKLGTELDRLAATELARMRRAIAAKERRVQAAYITEALATEAGTRYTPGELAAACGAAIALALKSTRGMRLTSDDWSDLRGDLIVAAMDRGARCDAERGELARIPGERTGTGSPADVLSYIARWERRPIALRAALSAPQQLPRREDLAGKGKTEGLAYLSGAARHLVALLARNGVADRDHRATDAQTEAATLPDTPGDALSMGELADALNVTKRERWAMDAAAGAQSADLAAEHGKTTGAMAVALTGGRNALRNRTNPGRPARPRRRPPERPAPGSAATGTLPMLTHRPMYPTPRNAPLGAARAASVLRYIDAVERATIDVPAAALEAADVALRWSADTRRNVKAPRTTGGWLTTTRPTALVERNGHRAIVPAIGPAHLRTVPADLPTIDRRALIGPKYLAAMAQPARSQHTLPTRTRWITDPNNVSGHHPAADSYAPLPTPRHDFNGYRQTPDTGGATVTAGKAQSKSRKAPGHGFTPAVLADLAARRMAELQGRRDARESLRAAAKAAGKLRVLPAAR
jgi:hypothetical protein